MPPRFGFLLSLARILPCAAMMAAVASGTAFGEDVISVPILVGVLKGAKVGKPSETLTADEQLARLKLILARNSKIFEQASVQFTPPEKDPVNLEWTVAGVNAEAKLNRDDRDRVRKAGKKELDNRFKGQGVFMAFAQIPETENAMAIGVCIKGAPASILRFYHLAADTDVTTGIKYTATTMAHELGHTFGLGHVDDRKNIMHEDELLDDTKLTATQIEKVREEAKTRGKVKEKAAPEAPAQPKPHSKGGTEKPEGSIPGASSYESVSEILMYSEPAEPSFWLQIELGGVLPESGALERYDLLFDADSNPFTGSTVAGHAGIDRVVRADVDDTAGVTFSVRNPTSPIATIPGSLHRRFELSDYLDPVEGDSTEDVLELEVPKSLLGLSGSRFFPVYAMASDPSGTHDTLSFTLDLQAQLAGPQLSTPLGLAVIGSTSIPLTGSGFGSGDTVMISINNDVVRSITADGAGTFSTTVVIPWTIHSRLAFLTASRKGGTDHGFTVVDLAEPVPSSGGMGRIALAVSLFATASLVLLRRPISTARPERGDQV